MKRSNLNLLVCLDALLTERSVTRAARKLDMSQPGMSNALARLRELTGNPLLIRSGNGFVLTDRALQLAEKVRAGLGLMEEIFANEEVVDLAHVQATVTITAVDSIGMAMIPELVRQLALMAPGVTLSVRPPDPERLREWLSEGECDIAIGYLPAIPDDLRSTVLFTQTMSCIMARPAGEPPYPPFTMQHYLDATHVTLSSPYSPRSTLETKIDQHLRSRGLSRKRAVHVSSVLLIPYIIAGSPHVATLQTWVAQHHAKFLPLRLEPLPLELPPVEATMVWHDRTHRLGLHRQIRDMLRRIAPGLSAIGHDLRLRPSAAE